MFDQYVGVNDVVYGDKECLLFNWASRTPKKNNVGMATLVNKATGETITKGRSLEGDSASHNLCVISDTRAITELQQRRGLILTARRIILHLRLAENTEIQQIRVERVTILMVST